MLFRLNSYILCREGFSIFASQIASQARRKFLLVFFPFASIHPFQSSFDVMRVPNFLSLSMELWTFKAIGCSQTTSIDFFFPLLGSLFFASYVCCIVSEEATKKYYIKLVEFPKMVDWKGSLVNELHRRLEFFVFSMVKYRWFFLLIQTQGIKFKPLFSTSRLIHIYWNR